MQSAPTPGTGPVSVGALLLFGVSAVVLGGIGSARLWEMSLGGPPLPLPRVLPLVLVAELLAYLAVMLAWARTVLPAWQVVAGLAVGLVARAVQATLAAAVGSPPDADAFPAAFTLYHAQYYPGVVLQICVTALFLWLIRGVFEAQPAVLTPPRPEKAHPPAEAEDTFLDDLAEDGPQRRRQLIEHLMRTGEAEPAREQGPESPGPPEPPVLTPVAEEEDVPVPEAAPGPGPEVEQEPALEPAATSEPEPPAAPPAPETEPEPPVLPEAPPADAPAHTPEEPPAPLPQDEAPEVILLPVPPREEAGAPPPEETPAEAPEEEQQEPDAEAPQEPEPAPEAPEPEPAAAPEQEALAPATPPPPRKAPPRLTSRESVMQALLEDDEDERPSGDGILTLPLGPPATAARSAAPPPDAVEPQEPEAPASEAPQGSPADWLSDITGEAGAGQVRRTFSPAGRLLFLAGAGLADAEALSGPSEAFLQAAEWMSRQAGLGSLHRAYLRAAEGYVAAAALRSGDAGAWTVLALPADANLGSADVTLGRMEALAPTLDLPAWPAPAPPDLTPGYPDPDLEERVSPLFEWVPQAASLSLEVACVGGLQVAVLGAGPEPAEGVPAAAGRLGAEAEALCAALSLPGCRLGLLGGTRGVVAWAPAEVSGQTLLLCLVRPGATAPGPAGIQLRQIMTGLLNVSGGAERGAT